MDRWLVHGGRARHHALRVLAWRPQEFRYWYTESDRNPFDIVDCNVARLTFYVGNEGAMQSGLKRQRLLTPTPLVAQTKHVDCQERPSTFHLVFFSCCG